MDSNLDLRNHMLLMRGHSEEAAKLMQNISSQRFADLSIKIRS
jgi:hypothetical protein